MANGKPAARKVEGPFAYWALVLKDFAQAWLAYGILSIVIAGITHGIFHIPLWQIVDVILALFVFFVGFFGSLSLIAFCLDLTRGEIILSGPDHQYRDAALPADRCRAGVPGLRICR